jgi:hypothetical protein
MGTDYPFDMGEYNPVGHTAGIGLERSLEAMRRDSSVSMSDAAGSEHHEKQGL